MPYTILCVVGGTQKRRSKKPLPARRRYRGVHIQQAKEAAFAKGNLPWFVLSSRFGLLAEGQVIGDYRYNLIERDVGRIADLVYAQLGQMHTREVHFYTFPGSRWGLYLRAMTLATNKLGTKLVVTEFKKQTKRSRGAR